MTLDLERLKALEAKATVGPWEVDRQLNSFGIDAPFRKIKNGRYDNHEVVLTDDEGGGVQFGENAELIVAARNALPNLIATIERYEAALRFYAGLGTKSGELGEQARAALGDRK